MTKLRKNIQKSGHFLIKCKFLHIDCVATASENMGTKNSTQPDKNQSHGAVKLKVIIMK